MYLLAAAVTPTQTVDLTAVAVALIAALGVGILSPLVNNFMTERQHEKDRKEDRADRKAVADAVAKAARQAASAADLLVASNKRVATAAETTAVEQGDKLTALAEGQQVIHTLVNSSLTSSMQGEHDGIVRELALLRTIGGAKPSPEIAGAIKIAQARATELGSTLVERRAATEVVADQEKVTAAAIPRRARKR